MKDDKRSECQRCGRLFSTDKLFKLGTGCFMLIVCSTCLNLELSEMIEDEEP